MEDMQIIDLFWNRDEQAIKETDEKYNHYLSAISYNIIWNHQDAEECINDTYIKAWNSMPPKKPEFLKSFLGAITRNLSLDCYRKKHTKKREGDEFVLVLDELTECISKTGSVDDEMENAEIAKQISYFLKQQSKEKRLFFVRRYWYCDSIGEIATKYKCSESKVKSLLFEMRKKLKDFLEEEGIAI